MKRSAPLRNRKPMPRGKPLRARRPDAPSVEREVKPMALLPARTLHKATYAGTASGVAVEKDPPVRSPAYRRLVAALGCIHCGRPGPSQAAHPNFGKGMALKASDTDCFPLCVACHRAFDQGALFTKDERRRIEPQWGRATRAVIRAMGTWPKRLKDNEE